MIAADTLAALRPRPRPDPHDLVVDDAEVLRLLDRQNIRGGLFD